MSKHRNKSLLDISVNYKDMLKRLSVNNEEIIVQSPICQKVLSRPIPLEDLEASNPEVKLVNSQPNPGIPDR